MTSVPSKTKQYNEEGVPLICQSLFHLHHLHHSTRRSRITISSSLVIVSYSRILFFPFPPITSSLIHPSIHPSIHLSFHMSIRQDPKRVWSSRLPSPAAIDSWCSNGPPAAGSPPSDWYRIYTYRDAGRLPPAMIDSFISRAARAPERLKKRPWRGALGGLSPCQPNWPSNSWERRR